MSMATLVSVDLDGIGCYHAIHGLPAPDAGSRALVLRRALPRFLELFERTGVRATFFVIGSDLAAELDAAGQGATLLADALAAGHELGNHSHAHAYDLVHWRPELQRADLIGCDAVLRSLGAEPVGFRAPGYTHDARLLATVDSLGYRYDSSALPSPSYYAAKLAAIGWHRLRGRRSSSLVGGARSFLGARAPHPIAGTSLWELPISTVGPARWPLVGTFLLAGPPLLRRAFERASARAPSLHLELHGIDLVDADRDGVEARVAALQPELRTPLAVRLTRLETFLHARRGFTRLCDAAAALASEA
jgi:peptidoglycan-N-acetylglucosamine deacetylase